MVDFINESFEITGFDVFFFNTSGFSQRRYLSKPSGFFFVIKINLVDTPPSGGQGLEYRMDTI